MSHYSLGTIHISTKTHQYLEQVLSSKRLSYGPFCQKFEKKFAQLHQVETGIVCSSGTATLHTILTALKIHHHWEDEAEVITPALTFVATINSIIQAKLKPVLVDVEPNSYNINPKLIESKITKKTRVILPVHLFGKPAKMQTISLLAKKHKLTIVEDCCETIAAKYMKKSVGSWGEAAAFSTNSAHILATGIGGVITTNNPQLAELMRSLINHGRHPGYLSIDDDSNKTSDELKKIVEQRFLFNQVGYSYRLSELEAAVGLAQLEELPKLIKRRVENAAYLNHQLKPLTKWLQLPIVKEKSHVYMAYPISLTKKAWKLTPNIYRELIEYLENKDIETRPLMPVLNQPAYEKYDFNPKNYPVASGLLQSGFYVGCHQDLSQNDLDYLVNNLKSFFSQFS